MVSHSSYRATRLKRPRYPMPPFVNKMLEEHQLLSAYHQRPPYQQNDYMWWITSAKKESTQMKRTRQMLEELKSGDLYMNMPYNASNASKNQPK